MAPEKKNWKNTLKKILKQRAQEEWEKEIEKEAGEIQKSTTG